MKLHPEYIVKDERRFVVLPYEEFVELQKRLADAEDLFDLREAKREEADAPTVSLDEMKQELGLD